MNILFPALDFLKILFQAFRYGIVNIPIDNSSSIVLKAMGLLNPFFIINRKIPHGLRIRNFLESLGPMFIKFGQLLSTRTDAISIEIASYLKGLTDQCTPFSTKQAKEIIEESLKINLSLSHSSSFFNLTFKIKSRLSNWDRSLLILIDLF